MGTSLVVHFCRIKQQKVCPSVIALCITLSTL